MPRILLAFLAALLLAPAALADVLIDNVNGYTLTQSGELMRFSALLVGNDGRVKDLIRRGEGPRPRSDYRVDGRGRTLLPGLIDAHGHVMELGFNAMQLDLSDTKSLAEALAKTSAYSQATISPRWVVGRGWNQERWGLGRFPTAAELDSAVRDRPVWLERVDGHAGWANGAAMREAGITAATKDPPGGRIERGPGGQPTGVFVDAAKALIEKAIPAPVPRTRDRALQEAQHILLSYGVTATSDMGTSAEDWLVMRRAGDTGQLNVRIVSYGLGLDNALAVAGTGPTPWLYDSRLRMIGVKFYADGALGSRGAWLKRDYSDKPGQRGLPFHTDTEIRNLMSRAAMDNFQIAVHAIGDAANAQVLDAIEELSGTYKGDRRWRIEHAQIVDPVDLPRFARFGTIASMQPVHQTSDRTMAEARLGPQRLAGAYAWHSMIANKVPLAFGSDYPVESPNPFPAIAAAVSRQDAQGQPPGGWMPQERVSIEQALDGFTRTAAYAGFAEDRLGTLERGRLADFIFVDRDIFSASPQDIRTTQVLETWTAGRKVWERGQAPAPAPTGR
jgi:predicted amidohydrolase YtcJ